MGTSTDSTGRQESESIITVIPWSCVNYCIINELVQLLNPSSVFGHDWKGLASHLGYSHVKIAAIESEKKNNTEELFKDYARNPNASFNEVYTSLEKLKRQDCLDVLIKHYDEIKRAYHQQRQQPSSSSFHLSGGEMHSPSSGHYWSSHPSPYYVCGGMSQSMAGPPHSPHPCCSIAHRCTNTHLDHCSLQAHQHAIAGYPPIGQIPPSQTPIHYDCSPAPGYFPSHHQMNVQFHDRSLHNHGINSPPNSQYQNISGPSGGRQPLSRMSQNPEPGYRMERSVPIGGHPQSSLPGNSRPEELPEMSLPPVSHNIYPQKVHTERSPLEEMASYSQSASLNQNHYPYSNLPRNINPCDNSNLTGMNSSSLSNSNNNSWQQMDASLSQSQSSLLTNGMAAAPSPHNVQDHQERKDLDSKESLAKLFKISKFPKEYQPTEEYTRVVAEQKIEEKKSNKSGRNNNKDTPSISSGSSSGSSRSSGSRSGAAASENANTYPLRAKVLPNDMAKDFASISLKKSPSLPQSYKPQQFKKVHGTRLFVTYSPDSEQHKADILRLCVFLKDNNFKSYVDVKDAPRTRDNRDEYISRFEAADHILMCVSPTYLRDTSEIDPLASNERQLHTHQIYKWMHQEHLNKLQMEQARQRAIILLFDSVTSDALPDWMKEYPTYKWPTEYEDLFWILMNPEDKVKAKCNGASS